MNSFTELSPLTEGQRAAIAHSGGFHEEAMAVIKAINPKAGMLPEERRCFERVLDTK